MSRTPFPTKNTRRHKYQNHVMISDINYKSFTVQLFKHKLVQICFINYILYHFFSLNGTYHINTNKVQDCVWNLYSLLKVFVNVLYYRRCSYHFGVPVSWRESSSPTLSRRSWGLSWARRASPASSQDLRDSTHGQWLPSFWSTELSFLNAWTTTELRYSNRIKSKKKKKRGYTSFSTLNL